MKTHTSPRMHKYLHLLGHVDAPVSRSCRVCPSSAPQCTSRTPYIGAHPSFSYVLTWLTPVGEPSSPSSLHAASRPATTRP